MTELSGWIFLGIFHIVGIRQWLRLQSSQDVTGLIVQDASLLHGCSCCSWLLLFMVVAAQLGLATGAHRCGLSCGLGFLAAGFQNECSKKQGAKVARSLSLEPRSWHNITSVIFYPLSSDRIHLDLRGQRPLFSERKIKDFVAIFTLPPPCLGGDLLIFTHCIPCKKNTHVVLLEAFFYI